MKKAKKILSLLLVIALTATITLSATLAYLTDEDEAVNVMVMGNIDIEQREHDRNGEDFEQGQILLPIVGNPLEDPYQDANGYPTPDNYIDKIVTVENTGDNTAYVRTFIAIPVYNEGSADIVHWIGYGNGANGDAADAAATWVPDQQTGAVNNWTWAAPFTTEIDGQQYKVYTVTHTTPLEKGAVTAPNLAGVYLDSAVDFNQETKNYTYKNQIVEGFDGTVEVLVATQAVQYDSGWADAEDALNTAFYIPSTDAHPWTHGVMGGAWTGGADSEGLAENVDEENKTVGIYTPEQLKAFADAVNGTSGVSTFSLRAAATNPYQGYTAKLMANINLNNVEWTPIGVDGEHPFVGVFDGNGYTVSNVKLSASYENAGLFGMAIYNGTVIKNLTINNISISGTSERVGAVVGLVNNAVVENCRVINAGLTSSYTENGAPKAKIGGIIGDLASGILKNSSVSDSDVLSNLTAGALIGRMRADGADPVLTNSTATNVTVAASAEGNGYLVGSVLAGVAPDGNNAEDIVKGEMVAEGVMKTAAKEYKILSKAGLMNIGSVLVSAAPNEANIQTVDLMADVDLKGETWEPIASMWVTFNGNGHTISNLKAGLAADGRRSGFWAYAGAVTINDLTLHNVDVTGSQAGIFAGAAEGMKVNNCHLTGKNTVTFVPGVETWNGVGAITGVLTESNINVEITAGTTVTVNKGTMTTDPDCAYVDALTGYIQKNKGTITNKGTVTVNTVAANVDTLDDALAAGENVVLNDDMTFSAKDTSANSGYGATGVKVNGGVFDGNGNTLTVQNAWNTWDCAVNTNGGTIKNLTINSAMRGIFMGSANADVYIDNVIIDGTVYTFNSDGGSKDYGVYISNSTLNGWTSFSNVHKEVVFTNCSFGEGSGYAFCRPYNATDFKDCAFEEGFEIDAVAAITFENCTLGGVALTAENIATLVTSGTANATVK